MCAIVCPCKPDCPNRGELCQAKCGKYKIYRAMRDKEYVRRFNASEEKRNAIEYHIKQKEKNRRRYGS